MKRGILYKISLAVGPAVYLGLARLLFATCRRDDFHVHFREQCEAAGPFIMAFWHYGIYYIMLQRRSAPWVAMVSASADGEYVSRVLNKLGFETVRGSRGKGKSGFAALREMIGQVSRGRNAALVADGSQGPEFVAQPGAILLASRTNVPILPLGWAADRYWRLRSWDRSVVPKPFARIVMGYGEPLTVPAGIKSEAVEQYRFDLERRLNALYSDLWKKFGQAGH